MKKRSFLLLEIIIALSIVGFVSYLLIRHPFEQLKKEWELLNAIEEERLWDLRLMEIKKSAYTNAESLPKQKSKKNLQSCGKRKYCVWATVSKKNDKMKQQYLVHVWEKDADITHDFNIEIGKEKSEIK
jgi:hypothetical protein